MAQGYACSRWQAKISARSTRLRRTLQPSRIQIHPTGVKYWATPCWLWRWWRWPTSSTQQRRRQQLKSRRNPSYRQSWKNWRLICKNMPLMTFKIGGKEEEEMQKPLSQHRRRRKSARDSSSKLMSLLTRWRRINMNPLSRTRWIPSWQSTKMIRLSIPIPRGTTIISIQVSNPTKIWTHGPACCRAKIMRGQIRNSK